MFAPERAIRLLDNSPGYVIQLLRRYLLTPNVDRNALLRVPHRKGKRLRCPDSPGHRLLVSAGDFGALDPVDATVCSCDARSAFRIGAQWPRQGTRQQGRRQRGIGSVIARGIKCSQRHLSCEKRALELLMSRTLNVQAPIPMRTADRTRYCYRLCISYQRLKFPRLLCLGFAIAALRYVQKWLRPAG